MKSSIDIIPHEYSSADDMYFVYSFSGLIPITEDVQLRKTNCFIVNKPFVKINIFISVSRQTLKWLILYTKHE